MSSFIIITKPILPKGIRMEKLTKYNFYKAFNVCAQMDKLYIRDASTRLSLCAHVATTTIFPSRPSIYISKDLLLTASALFVLCIIGNTALYVGTHKLSQHTHTNTPTSPG